MNIQQIFSIILLVQCVVLLNFWDYIFYGLSQAGINYKGKYNHLYPISLSPQIPECKSGRRLQILIIITSYVGNVELRNYHRQGMPKEYLKNWNATRIFLLGRLNPSEKLLTQEAIEEEFERFGDIVQGSFVDAYKNLTYKHLMGLHWAATECNNTDYVFKVDDDVVFDYTRINQIINKYNLTSKENILGGSLLLYEKPIRDRHFIHFVSSKEYSDKFYPPYFSGLLYIIPSHLAGKIVSESTVFPFFWIDDVFVTGILSKSLNLQLKDIGPFLTLKEIECCLKLMIQNNVFCDLPIALNEGKNDLIFEFNKVVRDKINTSLVMKYTNELNNFCYYTRELLIDGIRESALTFISIFSLIN